MLRLRIVYVGFSVYRDGSDSHRPCPAHLGLDQVVEKHYSSHYSFDLLLCWVLFGHCLSVARSLYTSLRSVHSEFPLLRSDSDENLRVRKFAFFGEYPFCNWRRLASRSHQVACSCLRRGDASLLDRGNEQRIILEAEKGKQCRTIALPEESY